MVHQVAWIDTEGTFRGDRVRSICDRFNLDQRAVLENIVVCRTFTHEMLEGAVVAIAAKMSEARAVHVEHFCILLFLRSTKGWCQVLREHDPWGPREQSLTAA